MLRPIVEKVAIQFFQLIWVTIRPPWGGGGFDITKAKSSDEYYAAAGKTTGEGTDEDMI